MASSVGDSAVPDCGVGIDGCVADAGAVDLCGDEHGGVERAPAGGIAGGSCGAWSGGDAERRGDGDGGFAVSCAGGAGDQSVEASERPGVQHEHSAAAFDGVSGVGASGSADLAEEGAAVFASGEGGGFV